MLLRKVAGWNSRGYRLVTGASREPAMVLVSHRTEASLVVFAARTGSGSEVYGLLHRAAWAAWVVSGSTNGDIVNKDG